MTDNNARKLADELNHLLQQSLGSDHDALAARGSARDLLRLDESNWVYFFNLYRQKRAGGRKRSIRIHEPGQDSTHSGVAYPLSIAPPDLLKQVKVVNYTDLRTAEYAEAAKETALWVKKMQAGSGSSLTRTTYLSKQLGIPENAVKLGAKGTDLMIGPSRISIAEAQLLQTIGYLQRGEVGEIIFHDIVSSETKDSIERLWSKPSHTDPDLTYTELLNRSPGMRYFGVSTQAFIPTLDETGNVSLDRVAPGGHALFAVDTLQAAYLADRRPKSSRALIAAISNGEDLNSAPDSYMLGYMKRERVPIVLVTTERTPVDLKGGLLSLMVDEGLPSLMVLETAQANEAGQGELFARIPGAVSTNLTLFNYEVLVPLIEKEVRAIGEDEFLKVISPDVISNVKEQKDAAGVKRKYTQLEGAMGSTIMNLDRYWRRKYGTPLVHLINVDREHRTDFFSPIKSAFDYFMQFHSDRFELDQKRMRLKNLRPGELPQVSLRDPATHDKFYQDVQNVLEAFKGARIRELDSLTVEGQVNLQGVELKGAVHITADEKRLRRAV